MNFSGWFLGVAVCMLGVELSLSAHDWFRWVWIALLVVYFFVGLALVGVRVAKLVAGKVGTGGLSSAGQASGKATGPTVTAALKDKLG